MSRWREPRNILVALIFKCMCASVRVLQTEAPAALFLSLSLENHSLQSGAYSSSSTSSRSSSFRPSHGTSPSARALTSATSSPSLPPTVCFRQEATKRHSRDEPPVPPWQRRLGRDGGSDEKMTAGGNDTGGTRRRGGAEGAEEDR